MESDMEKNSNENVCYILNGSVWFYPESHALIYNSNGKKNFLSLNTPASRCFMLLISNRYNVVSREEFIENVWKSFGRVVASNTYYQNISILRKSLFSAGLDKDIILTMPRRGLMLNKKITIEKSKCSDINGFINAFHYSNDTEEFTIESQGMSNNDGRDEKKSTTNNFGFIGNVAKKINHFANRKVSLLYIFYIFFLIGLFEFTTIYIIH